MRGDCSVISPDELYATIDALQHIGSTAGVENSRFYLAPGNLAAAEYIYERMAQYGLNVRYEDLMVDTGAFATNVVGELPGRDPSKVYLVTAHFDSLSSDSGPAPGADDNASGVAGMLEIARVLSAFNLPYSVRFVALNAEEVVFQGADAFARRAALG